MKKQSTIVNLSSNTISSKIYFIRGHKVMLDADIAQLYGIETKRLKEQVRRNIERFPTHFMFELSKPENEILRTQIATLKESSCEPNSLRTQIATSKQGGVRYMPYAFTEHGVLMLANVLKSGRAIEVSIKIIDVFVKLREALFDNTELRLMLEQVSRKADNNSKNIELVFQYLDELMTKHDRQKIKTLSKSKIGFKIPAPEGVKEKKINPDSYREKN